MPFRENIYDVAPLPPLHEMENNVELEPVLTTLTGCAGTNVIVAAAEEVVLVTFTAVIISDSTSPAVRLVKVAVELATEYDAAVTGEPFIVKV